MILFESVIGLGAAFETVLFEILLTVLAGAAGVDQAAGAGNVADLDHLADDLVAGDHGEDAREPVVLYLVEIGVAYSAELDIKLYVVWANVAALEIPGSQIGCRGLCSITFYWYHSSNFSVGHKLYKSADKSCTRGNSSFFWW